jgi:tRNA (guanosine-2'-O-)-methyltransferase
METNPELQQILDDPKRTEQLLAFFEPLIRPERWAKMQQVLDFRTRHIAVAVEDIYQAHNASAVLRTCECLGFQDLHVIENHHGFKTNDQIALGSDEWMSVYGWECRDLLSGTERCIKHLKNKGYQIAATTLSADAMLPTLVPLDQPLALFFGTEKAGLSPFVLDQADLRIKVPMYGFTQSFNVSVSAALCLQTLRNRLSDELPRTWQLSKNCRNKLLIEWINGIVKNPKMLIKRFLRDYPSPT